ncbi:hypothetical protein ACFE04_008163 [Oxalis oulophora]
MEFYNNKFKGALPHFSSFASIDQTQNNNFSAYIPSFETTPPNRNLLSHQIFNQTLNRDFSPFLVSNRSNPNSSESPLMGFAPYACMHPMENHLSNQNIGNMPNQRFDFAQTTRQENYLPSMNFKENWTDSSSDAEKVEIAQQNYNRETQGVRSQTENKRVNIIKKGQWSIEEDKELEQLVGQYGVKHWSAIASIMKGRIGKQCRERWFNHLRPDIKKEPWTEEEDMILIDAHRKLGNKWTEISKKLPGRPENTVKNHWNAVKRKQIFPKGRVYHEEPTMLQVYIKSVDPAASTSTNNNNNNNNSKRRKKNDQGSINASVDANAMPMGMEFDINRFYEYFNGASNGHVQTSANHSIDNSG